MTYSTRYRIVRQRWTIAFGLQSRSRGRLVAPFVPPVEPTRPKTTRIVFA